jgi:enoyl-CoA hydratase/carnithine racemase
MSPFRASPGFTDRWEHFDLDIAGGVATLTFARPDRLNALTFEVYADLRDLLTELPHREDANVLVIRGQGKGFCSGGDVDDIIGALQRMDAHDLLDFTRMTGTVVQRMREVPQPIIAQVNGIAAGAGAVIALAADLRVLARSAKFALLFAKVGLSGGDMGAAYLLPRLVGLAKASELLLIGDAIDADEADRLGLAVDVVPDADLDARVGELAQRLAAGPAMAHEATKSLLTRQLDMSLAGALELDAMTQALLMQSADHREFFRARSEQRLPSWRGR